MEGGSNEVMARRYKYKHIDLYNTYGRWHADYAAEGKRFALHVCGCRTKADALALAKEQVDFLNKKKGD